MIVVVVVVVAATVFALLLGAGLFGSSQARKYSITFTERGLGSGTTWDVTLSGTTQNSTETSIVFTEANGEYNYTVGSPGYPANLVEPNSGTVNVSGANVALGEDFTTIPLGTALAIGNPTESTCTAAQVTAHQCATAADEIVTFTVEQSTITMGDVLFEVMAPTGAVFASGTACQFAIMPLTGATPVGYFAAAAGSCVMTSAWTYTGAFTSSTPISATYTLTIDLGTLATAWTPGAGNYIVGLGVGGYSGTTSAQTIP